MTHAPTDSDQLSAVELNALARLAHDSRSLIAELQDPSGAYPASPTFSAYRGYSWFRDGAFIADAMSAAGDVPSADAFHDWCARVLVSRRRQIAEIVSASSTGDPVADDAMLPTRFAFDGSEGTDEWWDFQLDGYGTWLWALAQHSERHSIPIERWSVAASLAVDYLVVSWARPCYDWWEEHAEQVHVSTLGCVISGLESAIAAGALDGDRAAAAADAAAGARRMILDRGTHRGGLTKWLGSDQVDASLAALVAPLNVFPGDTTIGRVTATAVSDQLDIDGGVHRYLADTYYGGGQWPLLSCILGLARLDTGDRAGALDLLRWAASTARDGAIPEQVDRHLLAPDRESEWVERWGASAFPLLWSSAMYLRLAIALNVIEPQETDR